MLYAVPGSPLVLERTVRLLRADQRVPYGKVVEVMGLAQKAGLNRIGFVAEPGPAAVSGTARAP